MFDFFDYEDYDYYVAGDEDKLSPLIAAGTHGPGWGWWAKGQLRSKRKGHEGEWVEMGRTNRWKQRDKSGKISDGYGVYIGPSDIPEHGRFLVHDEAGKPLYVIHVPTTKFEPVKGLISEEYLRSIGIKTEGLDAKEEDVVDLETARKDPVTDDDIKLAASKMPKMPNLRKMVEGRTETNIPHSSLKDGDIVSDGKRYGLVADVTSEGGKVQAFVRWEDGQITQTVPAEPGKMTKAWPKAEPIKKKSVSGEDTSSRIEDLEQEKPYDPIAKVDPIPGKSVGGKIFVVEDTRPGMQGKSTYNVTLEDEDGSSVVVAEIDAAGGEEALSRAKAKLASSIDKFDNSLKADPSQNRTNLLRSIAAGKPVPEMTEQPSEEPVEETPSEPVIKRTSSKKTIKGRDIKVGDTIRAWDEDRVVKSIEPGGGGDRYVIFETPGDEEDDGKLIGLNEDVELVPEKKPEAEKPAEAEQPVVAEKPKPVRAADLKKGDRVIFDGRPHTVQAVGKVNEAGFRKVSLIDDEGEKTSEEMESDETLSPVVEKATTEVPAAPAAQKNPDLAKAKKMFADELLPGHVLLGPKDGKELGIVVFVQPVDKDGKPVDKKSGSIAAHLIAIQKADGTLAGIRQPVAAQRGSSSEMLYTAPTPNGRLSENRFDQIKPEYVQKYNLTKQKRTVEDVSEEEPAGATPTTAPAKKPIAHPVTTTEIPESIQVTGGEGKISQAQADQILHKLKEAQGSVPDAVVKKILKGINGGAQSTGFNYMKELDSYILPIRMEQGLPIDDLMIPHDEETVAKVSEYVKSKNPDSNISGDINTTGPLSSRNRFVINENGEISLIGFLDKERASLFRDFGFEYDSTSGVSQFKRTIEDKDERAAVLQDLFNAINLPSANLPHKSKPVERKEKPQKEAKVFPQPESASVGDSGNLTDKITYSVEEDGTVRLEYGFIEWSQLKEAVQRLKDSGVITDKSPNPKPVAGEKAAILSVTPSTGVSEDAARLALLKEIQNVVTGKEAEKSEKPVVESTNDTGAPISGETNTAGVLSGDIKYSVSGGGKVTVSGLSDKQVNEIFRLLDKLESEHGFEVTKDFEDGDLEITVFSPSGDGKFSDDRSTILTEIRNALGNQEPVQEEPATEEEPTTEEQSAEEEPQQEEPAEEEQPTEEEPAQTDEEKVIEAIKKETRYETLMDGDTDFDTAQTLIRSLAKRHNVSEDFIRDLLEKDGFKMPEKTETPVTKVSRNQPGRGHKKVSGTYGNLKPIDILENKNEPGSFARVLKVRTNPSDPSKIDIMLLMEDGTEKTVTRSKNEPLEYHKSEVTEGMLNSVIRRVWGTDHIPKGGILPAKEAKKIKADLKNMSKDEVLDLIDKLDAAEFQWRMDNGLPVDDLINRRKDRLGEGWVSPRVKELLERINSYEPEKNLDGTPIEKKEEPQQEEPATEEPATEEPQQEEPQQEEPQQEEPQQEEPVVEEPIQEEEEPAGQKDALTDESQIEAGIRAKVAADLQETLDSSGPTSKPILVAKFNENPEDKFKKENENEMAGGTVLIIARKDKDGNVVFEGYVYTPWGSTAPTAPFEGHKSSNLDEVIQETAKELAKYNSSLTEAERTGGWVRPQQIVPDAENSTLDFTPVDPKKSKVIKAADLKVGDKVHDTMTGDWAEVLEISEDPGAPGRINVSIKTKDGKVNTSYKKKAEVLVYREEEEPASGRPDTETEPAAAEEPEAAPGDNKPTPEKKPKPKPKPEEEKAPAEKIETYAPVVIPEGHRIGYRNPVPSKDLKEGDIIDREGEAWIIRKIERVQNSRKDIREAARKGMYLPRDTFKFTLSRVEDNVTETHWYGRTLLVKKLVIEPDPHAEGFEPRVIKVPKTFPRADLTKRDLKKMLKAAKTPEQKQRVLDLMEAMKSLNDYKKRNPGALDPKTKPLPIDKAGDAYKEAFSLHLDALGMDAGDKMALESWLKGMPPEVAARHRVDFMEANPIRKTKDGKPDPKQKTNIEKSVAKIKKAVSEREAPTAPGESRFKAKVGRVTIDGVRELFDRDLEEYENSTGRSKDGAWSLDGRYTPDPETESGKKYFAEKYVAQMFDKPLSQMTEDEKRLAWDQFLQHVAQSRAQETRFRVLQVEGTSSFIRFRDGHGLDAAQIETVVRQLQELELFSDIGGVVKHITISPQGTFTVGRHFMSEGSGSNANLDGFTVITDDGIFIQMDPATFGRQRAGQRMPIPKSELESRNNAFVETMIHEYFHAFAGLILGEKYHTGMKNSDIAEEFRRLFPELGEDHPISRYGGSDYDESFAEYAAAMYRYVVNKVALPNDQSEKRLLDFIKFFDQYAKNDIHPSAHQNIKRGTDMPLIKRGVSDNPSFPKSVNAGHDSEMLAEYDARRPFYENLLNPFGAPLDKAHSTLIATYVGLINEARREYDENGGQDSLSKLVSLIRTLKSSYDGHVFARSHFYSRQKLSDVRKRLSRKDDTKSFRAWSSKTPFVSIPGDNDHNSSYKNELSVGSFVDGNGDTRLVAYLRTEKSKGEGAGRESIFTFISDPDATFESFIENMTFDDFKRQSSGYLEAGQFEDDNPNKDSGLEIKTVFVNNDQRRIGLATALLEFSRQNSKKNVLHSDNYTKQVDAWARSVDIDPKNHTGSVKFEDTYDVIRQAQDGTPVLKKSVDGEIDWQEGMAFEHYENLPITYSDPLTKEQFTPEQVAALRDYGFSGYKVLEADPATLSEDQRARAETIRAQLGAAMLNPLSRLPRHMYLYHGASGNPGSSAHEMFFGKKEGDIISASSFVSTSMSPSIAHEYFGPGMASDVSGEEGFFVTIKAPQGCAGIIMPQGITARDEREVLLDSNAQFRVTGVNRTNRFTEDGEEIPGAFDTQLEVELIPSEVQAVDLPESKRDLLSEIRSYAIGGAYGDSLFSQLKDVTVDGDGGIGPRNSAVGYVSSELLFSMAGNEVPNDESLAKHIKELKDGVGFKNPVTVLYNPKTKQAVTVDGNHRVKAAMQTGTSHVPTIIKTTDEDLSKYEKVRVLDDITAGNSFHSTWPEVVNPYFVFNSDQLMDAETLKSEPVIKKMISGKKGIHSSRMDANDESTAGRRARNLMPQGDSPEDTLPPGKIVQIGPDGQVGVVVEHLFEDYEVDVDGPEGTTKETRTRPTGKAVVRVLDGILDDTESARHESKPDANGRRRVIIGGSSEAGGYNDKRQYTEYTVDSGSLVDVTEDFTKAGANRLQIQDTMFGNITQSEGEPIYGRIAGFPRPGFIRLAELTGTDEYGDGVYTYHEVPVSRFSPIQNRRETANRGQILEHSSDMRPSNVAIDNIIMNLRVLFKNGWIDRDTFDGYLNQIRAGFVTKSGAEEISKQVADAVSHADNMYDMREGQQPQRGKNVKPVIKGPQQKPSTPAAPSKPAPADRVGTPDFVVNPPSNKGRMTVQELIDFKREQGDGVDNPAIKKQASPISGPTPNRDVPVVTESRVKSNPPSELQLREVEMGLYEEGVLSPARAQEIHDALPFMDAETIKVLANEVNAKLLDKRIANNEPVDGINVPEGYNVTKLIGYQPTKYVDGTPITKKSTEEDSDTRAMIEEAAKQGDFALSEEQINVIYSLLTNNRSSVILGKAGTGKSTIIDFFLKHSNKRSVVLAPTATAAENVGGDTLHRFFGFPPAKVLNDLNDEEFVKRYSEGPIASKLKALDLLVIDEVSMVSADMLDAIDRALRLANNNMYTPFGGKQVVFVGDNRQLPVIDFKYWDYVYDEEGNLIGYESSREKPAAERMERRYKSSAWFDASAFADEPIEVAELQEVFRQKDEDFKNDLNKIRDAKISQDELKDFNSKYLADQDFDPIAEGYTVIANTRADVKKWNDAGLATVDSPEISIAAEAPSNLDPRDRKRKEELDLVVKVGARIQFTKNDDATQRRAAGAPSKKGQTRRWKNGDHGTLVAWDPASKIAEVRLEKTGQTVFVAFAAHDILKYELVNRADRVVGSRTALDQNVESTIMQLPFTLGYAQTVHRAQGQTLDKVFYDLGSKKAFSYGQVYVALSRVRDPQNLKISRPIVKDEIFSNPDIDKFESDLKASMSGDRSDLAHVKTGAVPSGAAIDDPVIKKATSEESIAQFLKDFEEKPFRYVSREMHEDAKIVLKRRTTEIENMPAGWTTGNMIDDSVLADSYQDISDFYNEVQAIFETDYEDLTRSQENLISFALGLVNGRGVDIYKHEASGTVIRRHTAGDPATHATDEHVRLTAEAHSRILASGKVIDNGQMNIDLIDPALVGYEEKQNAGAAYFEESGKIVLFPHRLYAWKDESTESEGFNWGRLSYEDLIAYIIAHEYGHQLDKSIMRNTPLDKDAPGLSSYIDSLIQSGMQNRAEEVLRDYMLANEDEYFAENYAAWVMQDALKDMAKEGVSTFDPSLIEIIEKMISDKNSRTTSWRPKMSDIEKRNAAKLVEERKKQARIDKNKDRE